MPAFAALDARLAVADARQTAMVHALSVIIAVLTSAVIAITIITWVMVADARDTTRDNNRRIIEMQCAVYFVNQVPAPADLGC